MNLSVEGMIDLLIAVAAVAAILAVAFAYGRGQYVKQKMESLRQDVVDERGRNTELRTESQGLRLERDRYKDERDHLVDQVTILNAVVSKQADFERIVTQMGGIGGILSDLNEAMNTHHREALSAWKDISDAVKGSTHE